LLAAASLPVTLARVPTGATRGERIAPWAAGLVLALPSLVVHFPPMGDLPLHEAAVGLLKHWGDPSFAPPHVYALNLGQPNQVFYFLILALASVVPIGTASSFVVAATVALLPLAAAHFAAHCRVTRWAALLVAPIGLGWMFFWGLLANLMGLATYLFALPALDRFVARPTRGGFGVVCGWLALLHFVHDLTALAAAISLVVLTLCAWRGWRENAARLTPALLLALLAILARAIEERHGNASQGVIAMPTLFERLRTFPDSVFAGVGWVSAILFAVGTVPLVLFALERRAGGEDAKDGEEAEAPPPPLQRFRFELLAGTFLLIYFVAPATINWTGNPWTGVSQVNQRFLPLAWSIFAVAVAPRSGARAAWRLPRILAGALPLAPLLVTWPEFLAADRAYRDLDVIVSHMERGSSHVLLELGPISPDALFNPTVAGGHVVAMIGGRALFDYTRSPTAPVVQRREAHWDEVLARVEGHVYRFVPAHDLQLFRYVILHTADPGLGELARLALEPEARTVHREGEFTLLESTLARVPLDAADPPFPLPHPPNLEERALATAKRLGAAPGSPLPGP
jgi:hypothetical protein